MDNLRYAFRSFSQFAKLRIAWSGRDDHSKVAAVELYDHQTDPQENVNMANDPKNAALVAKLAEQWENGWRGAKLK